MFMCKIPIHPPKLIPKETSRFPLWPSFSNLDPPLLKLLMYFYNSIRLLC